MFWGIDLGCEAIFTLRMKKSQVVEHLKQVTNEKFYYDSLCLFNGSFELDSITFEIAKQNAEMSTVLKFASHTIDETLHHDQHWTIKCKAQNIETFQHCSISFDLD